MKLERIHVWRDRKEKSQISQQGNANAKILPLINKDSLGFKIIKFTVNQNSEWQRQDKRLHKNQVTPVLLTMILPYFVTIKRQDIVYTAAYL